MALRIKSIEVGSFAANCYLVSCEDTKEAVLIDPGAEAKKILQMVAEAGVTVKYVLNTHGHIDHMGADAEVSQALGAPLYIHEGDHLLIQNPRDDLAAYQGVAKPAKADGFLQDGDIIRFGKEELKVLSTPGHSPGSVCFYNEKEKVLFSGDTLFAGSIGRTDFPGGSFPQIISSIKEKLLVLPEDTVVLPGHGPASTIGAEKRYNPFLQ